MKPTPEPDCPGCDPDHCIEASEPLTSEECKRAVQLCNELFGVAFGMIEEE